MPNSSYMIVGADVGLNTHYLQSNGTITTEKKTENTPLDVEYIGRVLVDFSKRGKDGVSEAEKTKRANELKHALMVVGMDPNVRLTPADKLAILERTTVRIVFEERGKDANQKDTNERILTIPADGMLARESKNYEDHPPRVPFEPPLSYELDSALERAHMKTYLLGKIDGFVPPRGNAAEWTSSLKAELIRQITAAIDSDTSYPVQQLGQSGGKAAIMSTPVRAFHRAVGIYSTNTCRK